MLSQRTIDVIKSTVPVLEVHGAAITGRFYEMMFTAHPELLNIFNHANQKQGRQQHALAAAVYAAAANIDRLEALLPAVMQIAHKHRSLGVKPEHYPIVGRHLLAAIKDVLGEAATDEIIQAWADAYDVLAGVFIRAEAALYAGAAEQPGGWHGFKPFLVERKVRESRTITSFYLVPQDGEALPGFRPGQYVSIKLDMPGESTSHIRQYSLSDAPGKRYYRISVKREEGRPGRPAGKVSTYLHDAVEAGDTLPLSAPAGDFVLGGRDDRPVVLISAGVGLTPMMSMLATLAEAPSGRPITFIHAARNGESHAMKDQLKELARTLPGLKVHVCYSKPTEGDKAGCAFSKDGRIDKSWLQSVIPAMEADFYFCGPQPFMKTVYRALNELGIDEADMHYEFFGPKGDFKEAGEVKAVSAPAAR